MTTLLDLVRDTNPQGILDPIVETLLGKITASVASLQAAAEDVGTAAAEDLLDSLESLLPVPMIGAAIEGVAAAAPVKARRLGVTGWELVVELPHLELTIPELDAGKVEGDATTAHVVKAPELGTVKLVLDGSGAGTHAALTIQTPTGTDVSVSIGSATVSLTPAVLALPFGFGISVGPATIGEDGITIPDLGFYLPPIPRLPVTKISAPVSIGSLMSALPGVDLEIPHDVDIPDAAVPAELKLFVQRPTARTLRDLVPTKVSFALPLDGGSFEIDPGNPLDPAATGGGELRIRGELGVTEDGATFHAELEGAGGPDGIATVGGATLALAAAIAPHLLPPDARNAAATTIIAAAGAFAGTSGGGSVVVHGLSLDASWTKFEAAPSNLAVRLDYEARLGIDISAGSMQVRTKPGKPMRVRYRDVGVDLAAPPLLDWDNAPMNLVSPGDWEVKGIPEDLLRIGDIRTGKGSLIVDIDLETSLSLGVVTIDSTTVRIEIDSSPSVMPAGFGIGVDLPGVLQGHGQLIFPPDGGFGAALDVTLPSIGAAGRAVIRIGDPLVVVAFEARLFAPIPFANSGLGLFGLSGAMASGASRVLPNESDPILREVKWTPFNPAAWDDGSQVFVGIGADIGTVPDLGFAFYSKAAVLVGLPDPMLRIALQAELLRGASGQLKGVLLIDGEGVKAGVVGDFTIPVLLTAEIPAGAEFPFTNPDRWAARLGGDGDAGRMGPVMIHILPDLLDLDAWAFLMVFGNASTTVGARMAPPGFVLDGLSLAFGAGVDVHWAAGPFSFDAHGVVMAVLTHKPPPPGSADHPWILAGLAEIRGSVDLGPVSIGASAHLDVLVQDDPALLYARAEACASVDLWLVEIEGCVSFDIGTKPQSDVPDPQSPFDAFHLTDRRGLVIETIVAGEPTPTVWADAIPAITFSHFVAAAPAITGVRQPIGDWVPDGNGWLGTKKLQYRFELRAVHVIERLLDGTEQEVGGDWDSSWQFPIGSDIWGTAAVPAEARALALGILDPQHRLQPATFLGPVAGDPIGVLGRLCLPLPPPGPTWYHGDAAHFDAFNGPVSIPSTPAPRHTIDLGRLAVEVLDVNDGSVPLDEDVDAVAQAMNSTFTPAWIDLDPDPLPLEGEVFEGRLWLPGIEQEDFIGTAVLRATDELLGGRLFLAATRSGQAPAEVSGEDGTAWDYVGEVASWGPYSVHEFDARRGTAQVRIHHFFEVSVALIGLTGVGAQVEAQWEANEKGRKATQDALATAASDAGTPRRMLVPGADYRVSLEIAWEGKGEDRTPKSGTVAAGPFRFKVANKGTRPSPPGSVATPATLTEIPIAQVATFKALASASLAATRRYDETVLDRADLGRYVGGFTPIDGTADHFLDDPVQVTFSVDHLPDLAARYEEHLSVVAVRTEGLPDTGPADVATVLGIAAAIELARPEPASVVIAPLTTGHLTLLDAARSAFVDAAPTDDPGCRIRRPGAVVQPLGRIVASSTYRLGVHVDAAPAGEDPEPAGSHDPVASSTFRTSRYANPVAQLATLGFTTAGGALRSIPLPDDVVASLDALVAPGERIGPEFDDALRALGLDGYRPPAEPTAAAIWLPTANGTWQIAGLLIESPEPIGRPGRLDLVTLRLAGSDITARYWDTRRTRLLGLLAAPAANAATAAELTVRDTAPGAASVERTLRASTLAYAPLAGVVP